MSSWDISFHNLTVGYGKIPVLTNINAVLPGGKISVILGGSGCGKSTLLRHIIGLSKPISGEICIGSENLSQLTSKEMRKLRRRMGVLFQDGALLGSLTIAQNVALPLSQHLNISKKLIKDAAIRSLKMVGLGDVGSYYPNQLSGGMRKRAGLARAIIAEPQILLCDEPTSGLDPITAARMDELLLGLRKQYPDMTVVSVSHDLASLKKIADYVLVLGEGKALFTGTLDQLNKTDNIYLKQFLNRNSGSDEIGIETPLNPLVKDALEKWLKS